MSPSMKVFRWLLSHLTLIIITLVLVYFYWGWKNDESSETVVPEATEHKVKIAAKPKPEPLKVNDTKSVVIEPEAPDPDGFSERMRQYQLGLSKEERERLASYNRVLKQDTKQPAKEHKVVVVEPEKVVFPDEQAYSNKPVFPTPEMALAKSEVVMSRNTSVTINRPGIRPKTNTIQTLKQPEKQDIQAGKTQKTPEENHAKAVPAPVQNKSLQEQIRSRQQQLSHQMISMLTAKAESEKSAQIKPQSGTDSKKIISMPAVKEVVPVIKTPEQKKLLAEARTAFEQGDYRTAEEKYLRLAAMLPQTPDVMGELANVYKAQKRMTDYVSANTRFVKRLVNHYRFKEAWRVVSETTNVDKNAADKQRRIINKKQKQLEAENFIK